MANQSALSNLLRRVQYNERIFAEAGYASFPRKSLDLLFIYDNSTVLKKTPRNFSGTFTKLAELFFCLAVIGVGTVLALIVLIDDVSWKRRGIGFQLQGI